MDSTHEKICGCNEGGIEKMITDRELARYISSNLHLYLADEDNPVECKVVDVSKNNGGTVILRNIYYFAFYRFIFIC